MVANICIITAAGNIQLENTSLLLNFCIIEKKCLSNILQDWKGRRTSIAHSARLLKVYQYYSWYRKVPHSAFIVLRISINCIVLQMCIGIYQFVFNSFLVNSVKHCGNVWVRIYFCKTAVFIFHFMNTKIVLVLWGYFLQKLSTW